MNYILSAILIVLSTCCHGMDMNHVYEDLTKFSEVYRDADFCDAVFEEYMVDYFQTPYATCEAIKASPLPKAEKYFQIGVCYDMGETSIKDPYIAHIVAVRKYIKAADRNNPKAHTMLGLLLITGFEDEEESVKIGLWQSAFIHFQKSALWGDKLGELLYGFMQVCEVTFCGYDVIEQPETFFDLDHLLQKKVAFGLGWIIGSGFFSKVHGLRHD